MILLVGFMFPLFSFSQSENSRTKEDTLKTLKRAVAYRQALNCQKGFVDSLRVVYEDRLLSYREDVWSGLTDQQKATVHKLYKASLAKLEIKKNQFLEFEEYNRGIDPAIYDYMVYGFDLMHEFPSSKYFNLLGADNSELSFLDSCGFDPYFKLYEEFDLTLTRELAREGCRAHLAIPFYLEEENEAVERTHRRRNALFYLAGNNQPPGEDHDRLIDSVPVTIPSFEKIGFLDSPYTVDDFVNEEKVKEMGFSMVPGFIVPNSYDFVKGIEGQMFVMGTLIHGKTSNEKSDLIREFMSDSRIGQVKEKMIDSNKIYYLVETKENRHDLSLTVTTSGMYMMADEFRWSYLWRWE